MSCNNFKQYVNAYKDSNLYQKLDLVQSLTKELFQVDKMYECPPNVCNKILSGNKLTVMCHTCTFNDAVVFCQDCFFHNYCYHTDHSMQIGFEVGGTCDCGAATQVDILGCCEQHQQQQKVDYQRHLELGDLVKLIPVLTFYLFNCENVDFEPKSPIIIRLLSMLMFLVESRFEDLDILFVADLLKLSLKDFHIKVLTLPHSNQLLEDKFVRKQLVGAHSKLLKVCIGDDYFKALVLVSFDNILQHNQNDIGNFSEDAAQLLMQAANRENFKLQNKFSFLTHAVGFIRTLLINKGELDSEILPTFMTCVNSLGFAVDLQLNQENVREFLYAVNSVLTLMHDLFNHYQIDLNEEFEDENKVFYRQQIAYYYFTSLALVANNVYKLEELMVYLDEEFLEAIILELTEAIPQLSETDQFCYLIPSHVAYLLVIIQQFHRELYDCVSISCKTQLTKFLFQKFVILIKISSGNYYKVHSYNLQIFYRLYLLKGELYSQIYSVCRFLYSNLNFIQQELENLRLEDIQIFIDFLYILVELNKFDSFERFLDSIILSGCIVGSKVSAIYEPFNLANKAQVFNRYSRISRDPSLCDFNQVFATDEFRLLEKVTILQQSYKYTSFKYYTSLVLPEVVYNLIDQIQCQENFPEIFKLRLFRLRAAASLNIQMFANCQFAQQLSQLYQLQLNLPETIQISKKIVLKQKFSALKQKQVQQQESQLMPTEAAVSQLKTPEQQTCVICHQIFDKEPVLFLFMNNDGVFVTCSHPFHLSCQQKLECPLCKFQGDNLFCKEQLKHIGYNLQKSENIIDRIRSDVNIRDVDKHSIITQITRSRDLFPQLQEKLQAIYTERYFQFNTNMSFLNLKQRNSLELLYQLYIKVHEIDQQYNDKCLCLRCAEIFEQRQISEESQIGCSHSVFYLYDENCAVIKNHPKKTLKVTQRELFSSAEQKVLEGQVVCLDEAKFSQLTCQAIMILGD